MALLCAGGDLAAASAQAPQAPPAPLFQKGMTFTYGYRGDDDLLSDASRRSLEYLRQQLHVDWIALDPFAHQREVDEPVLRFGDDPPDAHLVHAIRQAHGLGLRVMLKPHIWLQEQADGRWRDAIGMASEPGWRQWFEAYQRFVLHYARLAERERVDLFCVGVELARATREREAEWRALVWHVRQAYDGPLVYAANWDEYDQVRFWDALDYIGINAFFPLADQASTSLDALRSSAARTAGQIELLHQRTGRPVLFTEVGYKSARDAAVRPWAWQRSHGEAADPELQSRCYQAVLETFWARPWFSGMYWWNWLTDLDLGGPGHTGFTPRGKPAELVLTDWYRRPRAAPEGR